MPTCLATTRADTKTAPEEQNNKYAPSSYIRPRYHKMDPVDTTEIKLFCQNVPPQLSTPPLPLTYPGSWSHRLLFGGKSAG